MGFARAAGVPVVLVGDIDRGGVIAALVGTRAVIDPADAAMIHGFIINKFRGDPALFDDGVSRDRRIAPAGAASASCPGWRTAARLPSEDAVVLERRGDRAARQASIVACRCCRGSPISTTSIR